MLARLTAQTELSGFCATVSAAQTSAKNAEKIMNKSEVTNATNSAFYDKFLSHRLRSLLFHWPKVALQNCIIGSLVSVDISSAIYEWLVISEAWFFATISSLMPSLNEWAIIDYKRIEYHNIKFQEDFQWAECVMGEMLPHMGEIREDWISLNFTEM